MTALVQILQAFSGAMWLVFGLFLAPYMIRAWRANSDKMIASGARNGCLALLMVGFWVRWFVWPQSMAAMRYDELVAWGSLYSMSSLLAFWFFADAMHNRGR